MKSDLITIKKEYSTFRFTIYKVDVGIAWTKEEQKEFIEDYEENEYECYSQVYDKNMAYYSENVAFELDYNSALQYAKKYIENGINGTYAIISKLDFDSKYYKMDTKEVLTMVQSILGGAYIEEYIGLFGGETLYGIENITFSLYKKRKKGENPYNYYKNGEVIENFIKKS